MDFENFDILSLETSFVDILDPFKGILEDPLTEFLTEFPSSLKFERTDRLDLANDLRKHAFVLCDDEMLSPILLRGKKRLSEIGRKLGNLFSRGVRKPSIDSSVFQRKIS